MCGCPNYSTLCYSLICITSNHYSILSDTSLASPTPSNNIRPIHASTPDRKKNRRTKENAPLRILNVNFQSIKGKQCQVRNLIDSTNPDILFGTETWIDSNIKDSQIFPSGYNIFRKDKKKLRRRWNSDCGKRHIYRNTRPRTSNRLQNSLVQARTCGP